MMFCRLFASAHILTSSLSQSLALSSMNDVIPLHLALSMDTPHSSETLVMKSSLGSIRYRCNDRSRREWPTSTEISSVSSSTRPLPKELHTRDFSWYTYNPP